MEKRKNKIKSAFALALSLGLLCQSFPALAEEKPWDVNDNIISFREIPDLVDQFSSVAKMEQDALAQSTGGMASVQKAVKDEKADILANLQESIDSLKEQKQDTTDPTTKAFLQGQINQLEKVKNSKKILPDIDSSLAEVNQGLVQLSETEKNMKKAEAKTEKAVKSGFYTGKKLLSDGMQNLYFSAISLENNKTMLEKRVAMLQAGLEKTERQARLGQATANDVSAAKLALDGAQSDLQKAKDGLESMKRNMGLSLGWSMNTYSNIQFEAIPDYPRNYLATRDWGKDIDSALSHNSELGSILRVKDNNITGWTEKKQSQKEKEQQIRVSMEELRRNISEAEAALNAAESVSELSRLQKEKAERMNALGLLGRADFQGLSLEALSKENAATQAKLDYNQAVFQYEEAVERGILSTGE